MIRAVLAAATAVALLAAAGPALADARAETTADRIATAGERLDRAAADLAADSAAARPGEPAARRTVRVRIPAGFDAAPVAFAGIGPRSAFRGSSGGSAGSGADAGTGSSPGSDPGIATRAGSERGVRQDDAEGDPTALGYRIRERPTRTIPIPSVTTAGGSVVELDRGTTRIRLRYVRLEGRPSVVLSRPHS
ncbi:DUF7311 family protein [Haloparvum sedimenti]|uniref:DUF7311 family protein n=1 Tax=Haloparvum sedimenti TaxID=1678448 RepID=UPI00071E6D3B|nr:hypothetical protein [Haloparvum sedimenti]